MSNPTPKTEKLLQRIHQTLGYFRDEFPANESPEVWSKPISPHASGITPNDLLVILSDILSHTPSAKAPSDVVELVKICKRVQATLEHEGMLVSAAALRDALAALPSHQPLAEDEADIRLVDLLVNAGTLLRNCGIERVQGVFDARKAWDDAMDVYRALSNRTAQPNVDKE